MAESICGHDCNEVCRALDQLSHDVENMAAKALEGLLKHNRRILEEADKMGDNVRNDSWQLTQMVLSGKGQSTGLSSATVVEVSTALQKIGYSIDKVIDNVRTKVDEGVLFSDKAVIELKDVYAAVLEGMGNIHDLILTQNQVLVGHITGKMSEYDEVIRKYAEEHQDRLIKGICLPKSSLLYLLILEALKDILWYIKVVAKAFNNAD